MKKDEVRSTKDEVAVEVLPARADFGAVLADITGLYDAHPEEKIKAHLAAAAVFGRLSLAHAITAGWLLLKQKIHTPYGSWQSWCRDSLGVSHKTADRYVELYSKTVGAARKKDGVPFENFVTERELDFATCGMEDKSVTRAMIELGVVKRNPNHGGARPGSGRKPKDTATVEAELDEIANAEGLLWAEARDALGTLARLDHDKDFLRRLDDEHLAQASGTLADLSRKAGETLESRLARKEGGAE